MLPGLEPAQQPQDRHLAAGLLQIYFLFPSRRFGVAVVRSVLWEALDEGSASSPELQHRAPKPLRLENPPGSKSPSWA